jgi:predicted small metal-binding protein
MKTDAKHQCIAFIHIDLWKITYTNEEMEIRTVPSVTCKDIGLDCPFEAQGTTNQELMRKFIDHAEPAHNMLYISADIMFRVKNAIKK